MSSDPRMKTPLGPNSSSYLRNCETHSQAGLATIPSILVTSSLRAGRCEGKSFHPITISARADPRDSPYPTIDRDSARNGIENHKMDPQSSSYLFSPMQTLNISFNILQKLILSIWIWQKTFWRTSRRMIELELPTDPHHDWLQMYFWKESTLAKG